MNPLDFILVLLALVAAVGGYRLGFLARTVSWLGMAAGFVVAAKFLPPVLDTIEGSSPETVLIVATLVLMLGAFVGQAVGLVVGSRMHIAVPDAEWRGADRIMGGVVGVAGVVIALWLLLPTMALSTGVIADQTVNSTLARVVHDTLPEPPDTLESLRRIVGEEQFGRVFAALQPAPDVGPPPATSALAADVVARVEPSTVKITGVACDRIQEGSGFVTVGADVVVTNAHVVAGHQTTQVERDDGEFLDATVVVFDPNRDLAVLRVPGLDRPPLPIAEAEVGTQGGVFGHPGGRPLRIAPYVVGQEVEATGTDIYDRSRVDRDILILASGLAHGDSGAAVIRTDGAVVGVAFAIAPDDPDVAYALDSSELVEVLSGDLGQAVSTGNCIR